MKNQRWIGLLFGVALLLVGCASGSAIVTGAPRAPLPPGNVKVYLDSPSVPFDVIGLVSASSDAGWTEQGSVNYALEELRKQAGRLGANGVVLISTGDTTKTVVTSYGPGLVIAVPVTAKTLQARAIFVRAE